MRVYIAGPMSGLPDFNYPAFFKAEADLRAAGHEPINPARSEGREGCKTWQDYMRAALRDVADADGVALLPGWHNSRGAAAERNIAERIELDVRVLDEWLAHPCPTPDCGQIRCGTCDERLMCTGPEPATRCIDHPCCTDCADVVTCWECKRIVAEIAQDRADERAFEGRRDAS